MSRRRSLSGLALCGVLALGAASARCPSGRQLVLEDVRLPGFAEPHTPGSGAAVEFETTASLRAILGPEPDLNHVTYSRTSIAKPDGAPPRAILILVPGFLAGASNFDLLARDLVTRFNGQLEVWAIERRSNQLEDRVGTLHAAAGAAVGDLGAIVEGAEFYFADTRPDDSVPFPEGDGDLDINGNGLFDAEPKPLVDGFGVSRTAITLESDDVRFAAYWGLDTEVRDWRLLVDRARDRVGETGVVVFGGHSRGATLAGLFAAYDVDPDPSVVDANYEAVDGLLLLEGGGPSDGGEDPDLASYLATVADFARQGGPDVFLPDTLLIPIPGGLGPASELAGLAAFYDPEGPSLAQQFPVFGAGLPANLFGTPGTNLFTLGVFIDDDFQPELAFRASLGFSDNGPNPLVPGGRDDIYLTVPADDGSGRRSWKAFDDPTLPSCRSGGASPGISPGCPDPDNGPIDDPTRPTPSYGAAWGIEREVTDIREFAQLQFPQREALPAAPRLANYIEWYFLGGRTDFDLDYGRDASALVAEAVATLGDEGPLVLTQNARVDVPVLAIGGSNGLAPLPSSFEDYLSSIATPAEDQEVRILEGYAHLDPLTAAENEAVPLVVDWLNRLLLRKVLETP